MKTIEDFDWTEIWNKAIDGSHWGQRAGMPARAMGCGNLSITGLSFLGLGAQPPTPEWGAMLNEGKSFMTTALHLMIFPGLMIMIVVLALNFLGDGLRDALDPRLRQMMMK